MARYQTAPPPHQVFGHLGTNLRCAATLRRTLVNWRCTW